MNYIYLAHEGTKRHSGRYPYGSGEDPYQHEGRKRRGLFGKVKKKNIEETKKELTNEDLKKNIEETKKELTNEDLKKLTERNNLIAEYNKSVLRVEESTNNRSKQNNTQNNTQTKKKTDSFIKRQLKTTLQTAAASAVTGAALYMINKVIRKEEFNSDSFINSMLSGKYTPPKTELDKTAEYQKYNKYIAERELYRKNMEKYGPIK